MSFKVILVHSAVVVIISAKPLKDGAHNLNVCDSAHAVNLVYQSPVLVEGKFLAKVEKDVAWPTLTPNTKDITCIMAINEDTNVDGGYASIVSGGLYEKDVEIRLTSQLGKGLNYTISIYTT